MKKRLVTLLAGLLTVLSMGFGLAQFSDVPAGHWAKEAVEALAAKGILVGFPDGTFRGNETLTRYQAALIIYRLLQQIEEELKAKGESPTMEAMSAEDLEALKNAIQELAAELAALGVRVSALEDSAATKDDIARLEAMIEELKGQPMPEVEPGMDQAALEDLLDRVEAASIAADTALAQAQQLAEQLEALAQDVEGVKGDVAALATQVEANAQAIQALNELAVLLNQDVLALQDRVTALEKALAELEKALAEQGEGPAINLDDLASKEDVAAVQEFAAALRSDLVGLSEKVTKLEGTVTDLSGKVATLQRNAFTISGSLSLSYGAFAGSGTPFDIDRVFSSNFSTGDGDSDGLVVDEADLGQNTEGETTATFSLTLQSAKFTAKSSPGGYNSYPDLVQFSLTGSVTNPVGGTTYPPLNLKIDAISTTLAVAQDQSLSFSFGRSVKSKFTEYVFDNDGVSYGHGFVATYKPGLLGATLTAVYASKGGANTDNLYARGARLTLAPMDGFSLGGSFVQQGNEILGGGTPGTTVYGVDAALALGPVSLSGEYFSSDAAANANGYYVKAKAGLGPVSVEGNYRSIGAGVTPANMLSYDADPANSANAAPFHADQVGYGVKASVALGPLTVGGFYDTYTGAGARTAYGANATLGFGAFTLSGYYNVADAGSDGTQDDSATAETAASSNFASSGSNYTNYGAKLSHDGTKPDAFIKGLNLTAAYDVRPVISQTDLAVYGDFSLDLGLLKAKLLGRYHDRQGAPSYTTVKYGIQASTQTLGLPLAPSLFGEYVARSTQPSNVAETKYALGLKLNEFLFKNSSLEVKYGAYQGQNINGILLGAAEKAWDPASDVLYDDALGTAGTSTGSLAGFYVTWSYWDLVFSYADFIVDNNGTPENGRGFKISYTVKF
ncbi:S-layer homology domain-containing protein [Thermus sp.]